MTFIRLYSVYAFLAIGFVTIGFACQADDLSRKTDPTPVAPVAPVQADDLSRKTTDPTPVAPVNVAPEGQIPLVKSGGFYGGFNGKIGNHQTTVKKTKKGLLIGQIFGQYGTVYVYDNGKNYRWASIHEKSTFIIYGPGQKRREVTVELDEPAAENVMTTRWGKVYADPRLLAGWIEGE